VGLPRGRVIVGHRARLGYLIRFRDDARAAVFAEGRYQGVSACGVSAGAGQPASPSKGHNKILPRSFREHRASDVRVVRQHETRPSTTGGPPIFGAEETSSPRAGASPVTRLPTFTA
jgi:hypothetical protein